MENNNKIDTKVCDVVLKLSNFFFEKHLYGLLSKKIKWVCFKKYFLVFFLRVHPYGKNSRSFFYPIYPN